MNSYIELHKSILDTLPCMHGNWWKSIFICVMQLLADLNFSIYKKSLIIYRAAQKNIFAFMGGNN